MLKLKGIQRFQYTKRKRIGRAKKCAKSAFSEWKITGNNDLKDEQKQT